MLFVLSGADVRADVLDGGGGDAGGAHQGTGLRLLERTWVGSQQPWPLGQWGQYSNPRGLPSKPGSWAMTRKSFLELTPASPAPLRAHHFRPARGHRPPGDESPKDMVSLTSGFNQRVSQRCVPDPALSPSFLQRFLLLFLITCSSSLPSHPLLSPTAFHALRM